MKQNRKIQFLTTIYKRNTNLFPKFNKNKNKTISEQMRQKIEKEAIEENIPLNLRSSWIAQTVKYRLMNLKGYRDKGTRKQKNVEKVDIDGVHLIQNDNEQVNESQLKNILTHEKKSKKEIFVAYYDFIKLQNTHDENIKKLLDSGEKITSKVIKREHENMINLAIDLYSISGKGAFNVTCSNWENIKNVVEIYRQILAINNEESDKFIENLKNGVWEKGMSCHRYNQALNRYLINYLIV